MRQIIIMMHGRDASRTDAGFGVLMIDLRGHGQISDARFNFGLMERNDVLGAVDWLRSAALHPAR